MAGMDPWETTFLEVLNKRMESDRSAQVKVDDLLAPYLQVGDSLDAARVMCNRLGMSATDVAASQQTKDPFLWCKRWITSKGILPGRSELVIHIAHADGKVIGVSAKVIYRSL